MTATTATLNAGTANGTNYGSSTTLSQPPTNGRFKFILNVTRDFDTLVLGATPTQRQWMSQTYSRMRGYSPFFDQALSWAPPSDFYRDLYALYRDASLDQSVMQQHPDWVLRDSQGRALYIPSGCDGSSCPQYAADIGSPGFRAWWVSQAQNTLAKGYAGIFVDDVNMDISISVSDASQHFQRPIDPRTDRPMTGLNWERYVVNFTQAIRAALPTAVIEHNAQPANEADPRVQDEIDSADAIEVERGFDPASGAPTSGTYEALLSHIDWLHARGKSVIDEPNVSDATSQEYEMASFYLVKANNDAIASDYRAAPDNWSPAWQTDLGMSQGNRYRWHGLWRRDFANGLVLTDEPGQPAQLNIPLGDTYRRISQPGALTTISLQPASGAVLLKR